jgi:hypothetical protein
MIKHVGKHNSKRIIILWKKVPGEDHMCLICYPDTLPRHIHDDLMKALESESGQQAKDFSDYLFRYTMADGNNALQTLHVEGMIKKVPTNQVIVTPDAKSTVRLDELNNILDKMAMGEEAMKELADLDKGSGMSGKKRNNVVQPREVGMPQNSRSNPVIVENNISISDVLTDEQLATQRRAQAEKMSADAKILLAEADRLYKEAATLTPGINKNGARKTKKTSQAKEA